ncbi:MAG: KEOPS complex N(6)-L-threonylcarbamoyladenine synthase Kae1 [Candidatus Nanoarchaeia archaeon]|nr:KEOPS complex N(6)-L-threonylcarbamoyladenine synthase Kae1 [Candidatus Nanoarchaeia archaeon]MDD5357864.1 KEOPS complex N(6)-L-threonylcarbamoyladenine synthase Kae1 [Candidatus Nanoarchaeia archaeon]MDD5588783.1 KEOPS complex N(6)-L-threonylcarbamoyladenine synthase Kae1 [Candidatus Nanoarchaeia archaeon]
MTIVLGIESTAHTFGIGIVRNGEILSNVKKTYTTEKGGIIPSEAGKHHRENKEKIYFDSLANAGINEKDIDAIAFSQGPGLSPCLLEGIRFAKELSEKLKKPIVPINHCIAHLEIGKITGAKNPVMLYTSGANTQIIAYSSGKYRIFGETLDLGVGNFIDTFARLIGVGFPGGPAIQKLAEQSKTYIELPYVVKGMDISLSGILTNLKQKFESGKYKTEDLCYSLQETVFAMLVETAERALAHTGKKELLLGGGVACNTRLQEMCRIMCSERDAKLFVPPREVLVDNGAMIAYLGEIMSRSGIKILGKEIEKLDIKPRQRTDEVEVDWKD